VDWGAQPISRFSLIQSRLMETWVHGWDLRYGLGITHPYDDRAWWLSDLLVRHVPYALAKDGRPVPDADLKFELAGAGGGSWTRSIGTPPRRPLRLAGTALGWLAWGSGRLRELIPAPSAGSDTPAARDIVETARYFA
jgi:uncharacterized protein (TIGR03083 family)